MGRNKNIKRDRALLTTALLVLTMAVVIFYDTPAPTIHYTIQDLEVPAQVAASYPVLMRYPNNGTNALAISLTNEVLYLAGKWTDLTPYRGKIESAGTSSVRQRNLPRPCTALCSAHPSSGSAETDPARTG